MADHFGINGLGAYIPRLRLDRAAIAQAHRWMAPSLKGLAKGYRAFPSWDEDAITMAVEAAGAAIGKRHHDVRVLQLASTTLPFADMQNASVVASALGLDPGLRTLDVGHSQRAATSALHQLMRSGGSDDVLLVASDAPPGKPASTQEMINGAGAAALLLGQGDIIARFIGGASRSVYFVDHFRSEGEAYNYQWEERWIRDEGYLKIVPATINTALEDAGCTIASIARLVLAAPGRGICEAVGKSIGFRGVIEDQLSLDCGYTGAAHPLLMLVSAIEGAAVGDRILLVGFGQGCDALVIEKLREPAAKDVVRSTLADAVRTDDYLRMAAFQRAIDLEWGMRSERDANTALTEAYRSNEQVTGFIAGKCRSCATIQFPQLPYCVNPECGKRADYEAVRLANEPGKVLTVTADWLSYYMAPPLYVGFVQFENGARVLMEMVDIAADGIEIGTSVKMAFRVKEHDFARGYRRYFWKAVPVKDSDNA